MARCANSRGRKACWKPARHYRVYCHSFNLFDMSYIFLFRMLDRSWTIHWFVGIVLTLYWLCLSTYLGALLPHVSDHFSRVSLSHVHRLFSAVFNCPSISSPPMSLSPLSTEVVALCRFYKVCQHMSAFIFASSVRCHCFRMKCGGPGAGQRKKDDEGKISLRSQNVRHLKFKKQRLAATCGYSSTWPHVAGCSTGRMRNFQSSVPCITCINCSHLQPLAATRVAASGRKWPQVATSGRKWPEGAASGRKVPQVAASGPKWPLGQVAASGRK